MIVGASGCSRLGVDAGVVPGLLWLVYPLFRRYVTTMVELFSDDWLFCYAELCVCTLLYCWMPELLLLSTVAVAHSWDCAGVV